MERRHPNTEPVTIKIESGATITTFFTRAHLQMIQTMAFTVDFWKDLFAIHNGLSCDVDERRCTCKRLFNETVWNGRFAALAEDVEDWLYALEDFHKQRNYLLDSSEDFNHCVALYHTLSAKIVEAQATHAFAEMAHTTRNLCRPCHDRAIDRRSRLFFSMVNG